MKRLLLLFTLLLTCSIYTNASHIIGGDFNVRWVEGNTFATELKLFRDCFGGGAEFDDTILITIFDSNTDTVFGSFEMSSPLITPIILGDECYTPNQLCVEQGVYSDSTTTLPNNPGGYYFVWERCCRNNITTNLADPGSEGMVFVCTLADPAIQNSTPVFDVYPSTGYFCIGLENQLNFNVTDADGDSLVYFFDHPLSGDSTGFPTPPPVLAGFAGPKPHTICVWEPGYGLDNIMGTTIPMTIDQETGTITVTPELQGVYVMAVYVAEFRDGVQIGSVRREIQFQTVICTVDYPPVFTAPLPNDTIYQVIAENYFEIEIIVEDQNASDPILIEAYSELFTPNAGYPAVFQADQGNGTLTGVFSWQTSCVNISSNIHEVLLKTFSDGCSGSDTTEHRFYVQVIPDIDGDIVDFAANVITPNNDSRNDYFALDVSINPCFDTFKVLIYNRWGLLVYETQDPLFKWFGKDMNTGADLPEGTYFYIIDASFDGYPYRKTSSLSILR